MINTYTKGEFLLSREHTVNPKIHILGIPITTLIIICTLLSAISIASLSIGSWIPVTLLITFMISNHCNTLKNKSLLPMGKGINSAISIQPQGLPLETLQDIDRNIALGNEIELIGDMDALTKTCLTHYIESNMGVCDLYNTKDTTRSIVFIFNSARQETIIPHLYLVHSTTH
jgi:hypothetical protein